ncbi:hypothetical protein FQR65_LT07638 [Abscondita terminalis]|nr:hypothetical protein FQR65_LT07638 [Abscondita terminalis]
MISYDIKESFYVVKQNNIKMKHIFALLLIAVILLHRYKVPDYILTQWDAETAQYHSLCMCESGVDTLLARRVFIHQEFLDNPCLMCYLRCLAKNMGMVDASDKSLPEIWSQQVTNVTYEIATDCVNKTDKEPDPCKKVQLMALCFCEHLGQ